MIRCHVSIFDVSYGEKIRGARRMCHRATQVAPWRSMSRCGRLQLHRRAREWDMLPPRAVESLSLIPCVTSAPLVPLSPRIVPTFPLREQSMRTATRTARTLYTSPPPVRASSIESRYHVVSALLECNSRGRRGRLQVRLPLCHGCEPRRYPRMACVLRLQRSKHQGTTPT